jgi:FixJ family two-component response regulator
MSWISSVDHESKSLALAQTLPVVYVVDDDASIRESLEALIRCEGWQPETFACAAEFLARPRVHAPVAWCST